MAGEHVEENHQTISYADFKKTAVIEPGTIINSVRPSNLYTTQNWISEKKVSAALSREVEPEDRFPISAYIHEDKGKRVLVLGDGNTRAIVAWVRGVLIEVTIKGLLPEGQSCISLGLLKRRYQDLFVAFEYK